VWRCTRPQRDHIRLASSRIGSAEFAGPTVP
jgi:hypothetical protein